ncbi:iron-siderophore ABC transporter substrate-binding protein [Ruania halotolerans]|uniref:iron-siderophore ABC transporter substrate-binding protein n=1 Tax=Ruania halotolerans TaxID=2897773 RepID=UPI001E3671E2|nr:iron-siderophore ABC transporter substrate-binding protein [Ruania halotolerans]UFU08225.1 iron-siderophore ABC transporter substrate-binding protein [Ruania halotolerans]
MSRRHSLTVAAIAAALALAACSGGQSAPEESSDRAPGAEGAWESVSIDHAFGSTEIAEAPQDVVTLGWGSTEAAIALGVVPVGIEAKSYAADDDGMLPWVAEALAGTESAPAMIPEIIEEPAYEEIDALEPDLILAPYSGITEEQYELLTEIAPTVVYPEEAWTTPWRDVVTIVGESLGLADEATALVADIDSQLTEAAAAHPELDGLTVAAVWDLGGTFYVYKGADPRVGFLTDLGMQSAPSVEELAVGNETFFYTLSYEETSRLESDLIVMYASSQDEVDAFLAQSYAQAIPAVASGAVAPVVGDPLIAAMSPPTALSVTWGLEDYLQIISEAATHVS